MQRSAPVASKRRSPRGFSLAHGSAQLRRPRDFDFVMLRADPPVNFRYASAIRLLSRSLESAGSDPASRLVNSPHVLLGLGGRLLPLSSPDAPKTLVSNDSSELCRFVKERHVAVFKTLKGSMGSGIRLVRANSGMSNVRAVVRNLTLGGTSSVLVQEYLENNLDEEKRVWYVDGKILGVCRKRFEGKRFPPRLARKNCAIATHLEPSEQAACERLGNDSPKAEHQDRRCRSDRCSRNRYQRDEPGTPGRVRTSSRCKPCRQNHRRARIQRLGRQTRLTSIVSSTCLIHERTRFRDSHACLLDNHRTHRRRLLSAAKGGRLRTLPNHRHPNSPRRGCPRSLDPETWDSHRNLPTPRIVIPLHDPQPRRVSQPGVLVPSCLYRPSPPSHSSLLPKSPSTPPPTSSWSM